VVAVSRLPSAIIRNDDDVKIITCFFKKGNSPDGAFCTSFLLVNGKMCKIEVYDEDRDIMVRRAGVSARNVTTSTQAMCDRYIDLYTNKGIDPKSDEFMNYIVYGWRYDITELHWRDSNAKSFIPPKGCRVEPFGAYTDFCFRRASQSPIKRSRTRKPRPQSSTTAAATTTTTREASDASSSLHKRKRTESQKGSSSGSSTSSHSLLPSPSLAKKSRQDDIDDHSSTSLSLTKNNEENLPAFTSFMASLKEMARGFVATEIRS